MPFESIVATAFMTVIGIICVAFFAYDQSRRHQVTPAYHTPNRAIEQRRRSPSPVQRSTQSMGTTRKRQTTPNNATEYCTICLEEVVYGTVLKCNHEFHNDCISKWASNNSLCPVCRSTI